MNRVFWWEIVSGINIITALWVEMRFDAHESAMAHALIAIAAGLVVLATQMRERTP